MSPSTREVTVSARVPARVPVSLTAISWSPDRDLSLADWVQQGRWLGALGRASGWWIGDWLRYGNARYGDKYAPTAQATGYDVQSLMNMAYVAGRFAVPRRRESLSFSHHAELAGLAPEEQELWLDRAEAEAMSVRALRSELRATRRRVAAREGRAGAGAPHQPAAVCPRCGHHFGL
jgi:signal transduction histidine kinase